MFISFLVFNDVRLSIKNSKLGEFIAVLIRFFKSLLKFYKSFVLSDNSKSVLV